LKAFETSHMQKGQ